MRRPRFRANLRIGLPPDILHQLHFDFSNRGAAAQRHPQFLIALVGIDTVGKGFGGIVGVAHADHRGGLLEALHVEPVGGEKERKRGVVRHFLTGLHAKGDVR